MMPCAAATLPLRLQLTVRGKDYGEFLQDRHMEENIRTLIIQGFTPKEAQLIQRAGLLIRVPASLPSCNYTGYVWSNRWWRAECCVRPISEEVKWHEVLYHGGFSNNPFRRFTFAFAGYRCACHQNHRSDGQCMNCMRLWE